ncbi:MAG: SIS domain-containing protein [Sandaracinaceae bacterium]
MPVGDLVRGYLDHVAGALARLDVAAIEAAADELHRARVEGRRVYVLGNGGSSATADHFAADLIAAGVAASSLASNAAVLTAISNDYGYEDVFARQLVRLAKPGELLVAFSASGASPSVAHAARAARDLGVRTIAFTGFDGGTLRELADVAVHVPTETGEYGPVEGVHLCVAHAIRHQLWLRAQREDVERR